MLEWRLINTVQTRGRDNIGLARNGVRNDRNYMELGLQCRDLGTYSGILRHFPISRGDYVRGIIDLRAEKKF